MVTGRAAWEEETVDLREAAATLDVSETVLRGMAWESELSLEPKWGVRERLPRQAVDSWPARFETRDTTGGPAWEVNRRT